MKAPVSKLWALIVGIPLLSLCGGALMFYLVAQYPDHAIKPAQQMLSKTSWQAP